MRLHTLFWILFTLFFHGNSHAQENNIQAMVTHDKIFTSVREAMLNPDSVFRLDLSRKKLKVVPQEIFKFKNLYELNLSRNQLESLPADIKQLAALKILKISNNRLKTLPPEIGSLHALRKLELNRNLIVTLPPEIGYLANLEILELWDNEIDSIPEELKNLKQLRILELRGILFSDEEQNRIRQLVPECIVYFSPSCLCKD